MRSCDLRARNQVNRVNLVSSGRSAVHLYLTRFSSSSFRKRKLPKIATKPATMKLMSNNDCPMPGISNIVARQIAKPIIIKKIIAKDFSITAKLTKGSRHYLV
jgi:hypothetical protein